MESSDSEQTPLLGSLIVDAQQSELNGSIQSVQSQSTENQRTVQTTRDDPKVRLATSKQVAVLGAVWIGVFLGAVDSTIVATLVSSISSSFGSSNQLSWLATAYLLSISATGALYGKVADLMGRRVALLTALGLFTLGTLGCALSTSMTQLILARLLAGCGGGGIMTTSSIIATDLVRLDQRAMVQGFANICYGAGAALGGPMGGFLTDSIGWRAGFSVQVPILVLAFVLVAFLVDYRLEGQATSRKELLNRTDLLGSITLIFTITCLLLSFSFKSNLQYEWSDIRVYGNMICFFIGLGLFIHVENRAVEPVLPIRLLKLRTPLCSFGVNFFSSMVVFSVLYMFPLWFETVKLDSATNAGVHLVPNSVALSFGSLGAGAWIRQTGSYRGVSIISCGLMMVGAGLLRFKLDSSLHEWIDIIPNGLGFSASTTSVLIALIAAVPGKDMAVSTGVSYLFRYTGQVLGVAASAAILQSNLAIELRNRITGPGAELIIERIRHESSLVKKLPDGLVKQAAVECYRISLRRVFGFNFLLSILSVILSMGIEEFSLSDK
ncbi:major facilitator superfamily domain-containing protein [Phakopsora pachyrhizi]|uniref:Major facilitator superfamily domain-containing protein n=1 Tax=Phakopsora pachyrhizi TaxID=170000 RepID=A0AAV0B6D7_PHAPC|nr:major facilitator superfamily domain-containing protein [Phakopsora pachyrhizi]CAH7690556.1 major facilitator superfamily domain-containing protein [Phakopsora pachyrhizi]